MLLLFFIVTNKNKVANKDGLKELVDLTNEVLGENSKYMANGTSAYFIEKRR